MQFYVVFDIKSKQQSVQQTFELGKLPVGLRSGQLDFARQRKRDCGKTFHIAVFVGIERNVYKRFGRIVEVGHLPIVDMRAVAQSNGQAERKQIGFFRRAESQVDEYAVYAEHVLGIDNHVGPGDGQNQSGLNHGKNGIQNGAGQIEHDFVEFESFFAPDNLDICQNLFNKSHGVDRGFHGSLSERVAAVISGNNDATFVYGFRNGCGRRYIVCRGRSLALDYGRIIAGKASYKPHKRRNFCLNKVEQRILYDIVKVNGLVGRSRNVGQIVTVFVTPLDMRGIRRIVNLEISVLHEYVLTGLVLCGNRLFRSLDVRTYLVTSAAHARQIHVNGLVGAAVIKPGAKRVVLSSVNFDKALSVSVVFKVYFGSYFNPQSENGVVHGYGHVCELGIFIQIQKGRNDITHSGIEAVKGISVFFRVDFYFDVGVDSSEAEIFYQHIREIGNFERRRTAYREVVCPEAQRQRIERSGIFSQGAFRSVVGNPDFEIHAVKASVDELAVNDEARAYVLAYRSENGIKVPAESNFGDIVNIAHYVARQRGNHTESYRQQAVKRAQRNTHSGNARRVGGNHGFLTVAGQSNERSAQRSTQKAFYHAAYRTEIAQQSAYKFGGVKPFHKTAEVEFGKQAVKHFHEPFEVEVVYLKHLHAGIGNVASVYVNIAALAVDTHNDFIGAVIVLSDNDGQFTVLTVLNVESAFEVHVISLVHHFSFENEEGAELEVHKLFVQIPAVFRLNHGVEKHFQRVAVSHDDGGGTRSRTVAAGIVGTAAYGARACLIAARRKEYEYQYGHNRYQQQLFQVNPFRFHSLASLTGLRCSYAYARTSGRPLILL